MDKVQVFTSVWNQYAPNVIHSTLSKDKKFNNIMLSDGTTKLIDLLIAMNNCDTLGKFLENMTDVNAIVPLDSSLWPGCTILHLALLMTENMKLWDKFFAESDIQKKFDLLLSEVNTSTEDDNYQNRIHICLEKGCKVDIRNSEGLTPIHLSFKLKDAGITDLLLNECDGFTIESDDLSFLHIACATGNLNVVKRLLNKGADVNSQTRVSFEWFITYSARKHFITVPKNSTSLHIAVRLLHKNIVEILLNLGADVYAQDAWTFTPIHSSIPYLDNEFDTTATSIAELLFERATNLRESLTSSGLSHLHVAAYADDSENIKKLLQAGSNIDSIFRVTVPELKYLNDYDNRTPLHVAMKMGPWKKKSCNAIDTLIRNGADIFQQTPEKGTPMQYVLHDCVNVDCDLTLWNYIKNTLDGEKWLKGPVDANGTTLLHVACYTLDLKWAKKLLEKGAEVNSQILEDSNCLFYPWKGCTPMHLLASGIRGKDNYEPNWNPDIQEMINFVNLLIDYGANLSVIDSNSESPLLSAHRFALDDPYDPDYFKIHNTFGPLMLSIADLLLSRQPSYTVNPSNEEGYSHFHYACTRNQVDIVKKFLNNGIDIKNAANSTALHFAIYFRSKEVACLLIERGADVNAVNKYGKTPLHIAAEVGFINFHMLEMLLRYGTDINARSRNGSTPIHCLLKYSNEITNAQLTFFINHGSKINIVNEESKGLLGLAMKNAKPSNRNVIFEELIDFFDIKSGIKTSFNPILDIVAVEHDGKLTLDFYLNAIRRFIYMGCKLDLQNTKGQTALYLAAINENLEAFEALLLLGANVNIFGSNNIMPIHPWVTITALKMFAAHVWKMKLAGMKVHGKCDATMLRVHEKFPLAKSLKSQCEVELAKMSEEKISESYTLRCLLQDWSPAMDYPTILCVQRDQFVQFFENLTNLRQDFPHFSGLLMMQYWKITARLDMYEVAMNILPRVLQINLPDLCLANILNYFNNDELEYFIKGQSGTTQIEA